MKAVPVLVALLTLVVSISPALGQDMVDLDAVKTYLMENVAAMQASLDRLDEASDAYHSLAEASGFDYATLWNSERAAVIGTLIEARDAWLDASPLYEQAEGIVAGVPLMAEYDVIMDAGASGEEDPEEGVMFDLNLGDGRVFERPGNLFGVLESTLWGTAADYSSGVAADLNLNSETDFGEVLPDAWVLQAAADTMKFYSDDLVATAESWDPTTDEAFGALVVMVPTMSEYFAAWRDSRFVSGADATRSDFVVISRLSDIEDILGGLIVVYDSVSSLVAGANSVQDEQIETGLGDLLGYVSDLYTQERGGRAFSAEEADLFGDEAQGRAQAITGQIAQVAAILNITLPE